MFDVEVKFIRRNKSGPPCEMDKFYRVNGGEWMLPKKYFKWLATILVERPHDYGI